MFLPLPSCTSCLLLLLILSFLSFVNITRSEMEFCFLFFCHGGSSELFEKCGVLVGVVVGFNRCCVRFLILGLIVENLGGCCGVIFGKIYDCVCRSGTLK